MRDLGRVGGSRAGRHAGRWAGGALMCLMLALATPAVSQQAAPIAAAPRTYAECLRTYVGRVDPATYCRRLFPATAPAAAAPAATTPADARAPVDITPQLEKLIESWANRPKPPVAPPAKPPVDPLAVIPEIQATCAQYAGNAERWRRCTADGWRKTGLRGQPPLVLQTPPSSPPIVVEPTDQTPVKPPPVRPPPVRPPPVKPEPPVQIQPAPPVDIAPPVEPETPSVKPRPDPPKLADPPRPPRIETPPVAPPSVPSRAWWLAALVALLAAGAGGFGLSRWLARPRTPATHPAKVQAEAAPCAPAEVALVADPGVVSLIPDGPPRAGLSVSMRVALDADTDGEAVRLEALTLEAAP